MQRLCFCLCLWLCQILLVTLPAHSAFAMRRHIHIVGSSTVFPFTASAAEQFSQDTDFPAPIVEATGTGGGIKLFCSGIGDNTPDFVNASRAMKPSELADCAQHGITDIVDINIGYDGIVLATERHQPQLNFSKAMLFKALAKQVDVNGQLMDNPYKRWKEIDSRLPDSPIMVYGPPPTSGTRDAFVELVMEQACIQLPAYVTAYPDEKIRALQCRTIREDGVFIEAGENDNLIVQKLQTNTEALGIFGYSFLEENAAKVQGSLIDGVAPTFESIADGSYGISRPLFVYMKKAHLQFIPGLREFMRELLGENALHPIDGYLPPKGLIPLSEDKRKALRSQVLGL